MFGSDFGAANIESCFDKHSRLYPS
jgi:hypothetical protein